MAIKQLGSELASRIAAGEVIERPASVVKELIENALDAGATRISVEVENGGRQTIRVSDNGCGIAPEEIALAFNRFATSKIDQYSDLQAIRTLGFRGEALPSIAAVADVSMVTNNGHGEGVEYRLEYGVEPQLKPHSSPLGTAVTVRNLFANTPARFKFLNSDTAETTRIQQVIVNLVAARPDVAFEFFSDTKQRLRTVGDGTLTAAAAAMFGGATAADMIKIESPKPLGEANFSVKGVVSPAHIKRASRKYIFFAVNQRPVTNRLLFAALLNAYRPFLKDREYPLALIHVTTPAADVDVNVHPAKLEVRFMRESVVYDTIFKAVGTALEGGAPKIISPTVAGNEHRVREDEHAEKSNWMPHWPQAGASQTVLEKTHRGHADLLGSLRVVGQLMMTYIVAENPDGMCLIDQHAAHERIVYEDLKAKFDRDQCVAQTLLEPQPITLPAGGAEALDRGSDELRRMGFEAEIFGVNEVILRTVPAILATKPNEGVAEAFLALLEDITSNKNNSDWRDNTLKTVACHSSLRAGMLVTTAESKTLLAQLARSPNPQTCPHGRPTTLNFPSVVIERSFERC